MKLELNILLIIFSVMSTTFGGMIDAGGFVWIHDEVFNRGIRNYDDILVNEMEPRDFFGQVDHAMPATFYLGDLFELAYAIERLHELIESHESTEDYTIETLRNEILQYRYWKQILSLVQSLGTYSEMGEFLGIEGSAIRDFLAESYGLEAWKSLLAYTPVSENYNPDLKREDLASILMGLLIGLNNFLNTLRHQDIARDALDTRLHTTLEQAHGEHRAWVIAELYRLASFLSTGTRETSQRTGRRNSAGLPAPFTQEVDDWTTKMKQSASF